MDNKTAGNMVPFLFAVEENVPVNSKQKGFGDGAITAESKIEKPLLD
ncbi:MAG: hypothetical protein U9P36_00475 [Thermodesulfobacteriota bacterium]|nr:hypothetical protein [Thermodesulfobacteriota bacterium]